MRSDCASILRCAMSSVGERRCQINVLLKQRFASMRHTSFASDAQMSLLAALPAG